MSQTLHQIYQSKAIVLTRTMVIKFHNIAEAINHSLVDQGYVVDWDDPSTWKYYMNMFGLYHQADHDRLKALSGGETQYIQIKVAGENQPIDVDFTKELLYGDDADQAVANEYRFNTHYYNTLITKYPEFEDLILGVLNPVNIQMAIEAKEGEILYCGGYLKTLLSNGNYHYIRQDYGPISENFLIESNEENLIQILQEYIYAFLGRWWNANYAVTSDLFKATFIGILYLTIPQILGNIRLGNAKSPKAHSFHIREHLESFGNLGWVSEYLSKGVLLWLYRNLMWLDANRGKQKVFDAIVENVLTPSKIPIVGHRLKHDVSDMSEDQLTPDVFMDKEFLNISNRRAGTRSEIIDVIKSEIQLATENHYDQEGQERSTKQQSMYSMFDNLNTKVLESTVIDLSNHMAVTREDIGLNLWLFTASKGYYKGTVIFTNPVTNERMQFTPLNAYVLAFYCFNKGWANYEFEYIPKMFARLIPRHNTVSLGDGFPVKPKLEDVKKGVLKRFVTDNQIRDILGSFTPDFTHSSSISFSQEMTRTHTEAMRKYYSFCKIEDAQGRGFGEWIAHQCYWYDIECPLVKTETKYNDWLTVQGLEFENFTRYDYVEMGLRIVEAATGVDLNLADELRNRQTAALAILKHFASYTVQIIQNTVASDSYWLDWKTLRITNDRAKVTGGIQAQLPLYTIRDYWSITEGPIWLRQGSAETIPKLREYLSTKDSVDIGYHLNGYKVSHRERAQFPTYTVVGARIPEINIETREKIYQTLTSVLYPVNTQDRMDVTSTIDQTFYIEPRNSEIKEVFNSRLTIQNRFNVSPPIQKGFEQLDVSFGVVSDTIVITPPLQKVKETLDVAIAINNTLEISVPAQSVKEELETYFSLDSITIIPQMENTKDSLDATINLDLIELTPSLVNIGDKLDVSFDIDNTIQIEVNDSVKFTDQSTMSSVVVSVEIKLPESVTDSLETTIDIDPTIQVEYPHPEAKDDQLNVTTEVTAAEVTIRQPPEGVTILPPENLTADVSHDDT